MTLGIALEIGLEAAQELELLESEVPLQSMGVHVDARIDLEAHVGNGKDDVRDAALAA